MPLFFLPLTIVLRTMLNQCGTGIGLALSFGFTAAPAIFPRQLKNH
jgi:hypothetical protein